MESHVLVQDYHMTTELAECVLLEYFVFFSCISVVREAADGDPEDRQVMSLGPGLSLSSPPVLPAERFKRNMEKDASLQAGTWKWDVWLASGLPSLRVEVFHSERWYSKKA